MKPGAYQVDACVVVQHRAGDPPSLDGLALTLLMASPSPEGGNLQEVEWANYVRQPVVVAPPTTVSRTLHNSQIVEFAEVTDWPQATHVGLIAANGSLLAYGLLRSSAGPAFAATATFAPSAVRIRYS